MTNRIFNANSTNIGEINLIDVWKKLVHHKKIFWYIFFAVFIIGGAKVLFAPTKYKLSQTIEIGWYINSNGQKANFGDINDAIIRINKILFPQAVHAYNAQLNNTSSMLRKSSINIEKGGDSTLILSVDAPLTDFDGYKFIFQHIINDLINGANEYITTREKALKELKIALGFFITQDNKKASTLMDDVVKTLYLRSQDWALINNVSNLQIQIASVHKTKAIFDFMASDSSVGPSKYVLLILVVVASFFFAFFGVFIMDFIFGLGKSSYKLF
jgi:hypothetical protein